MARADGRADLIRPLSEWEALVRRHLVDANGTGFMEEADRGGLTALGLIKEGRRPTRG